MKYIIFLFQVLIFLNLSLAQKHGILKGIVLNQENNQPLPSANIIVEGKLLGSTTDLNGKFIITKITEGNYRLIISLIGFKKKIVNNVTITSGSETEIEVYLEPSAISLTPVIITASKREQAFNDVTNSVSVIQPHDLKRRNSITIDDALRQVGGINIIESQVSIRGSSGYSKGVGSRTLVLLDGIPLLSGDTGEIIFESLPTNQIERVEILKGSASALYGSAAMGGVINVITKNSPDTTTTSLKLLGGCYEKPFYDSWRWSNKTRSFDGIYIMHSRTFYGIRSLFTLSRNHDNGYRLNSRWRRWNFFTKSNYQLTPSKDIMFSFSYLDQQRQNFLFWRNLDSALIPPNDQIGDQVNSKRFSLSGLFKNVVTDYFTYNIKSVWYRTKWQDNIETLGNRSISDFIDNEIQINYQPLEKHIITFGVDLSYNKIESNIFGNRSRYGVALYLQDEYKINEEIKATTGARFDVAKLDSLKLNYLLNPKLGFVYAFSTLTSFRFSAGSSFRSPTVAEAFTSTIASGLRVLPNPNLKPENSWSFEFGVNQVLSETIYLDGALFWNEYKNLIEAKFRPELGLVGQFLNLTKARIYGTELTVKSLWLKNSLRLNLSYTYIHPEDIIQKQILEFRSKHLFNLTTSLFFYPFELGFDFRHLSRIERLDKEFAALIKDGENRVPTYVLDAIFNSHFIILNIPIRIAIQVNNLLQYHYVELIGNIAPIRNYTLSIETSL